MKTIAALLALTLFLAACGGEGDNVIHFNGRDETEAGFRSRVTTLKTDEPGDWVKLCAALEGKTPQQAAALLVTAGEESDLTDASQFAGATPKPGQKADADDLVRAARIVQDECG